MSIITRLAIKHKSDKYGSHFYTDIYEKYMCIKKNKRTEISKYLFKNKSRESVRINSVKKSLQLIKKFI